MDPRIQMPMDRSLEQIRFWAIERLCGHNDGLDQYQTNGPTGTPYFALNDSLPMDLYEVPVHEKHLVLGRTSMDELRDQFPVIGPSRWH